MFLWVGIWDIELLSCGLWNWYFMINWFLFDLSVVICKNFKQFNVKKIILMMRMHKNYVQLEELQGTNCFRKETAVLSENVKIHKIKSCYFSWNVSTFSDTLQFPDLNEGSQGWWWKIEKSFIILYVSFKTLIKGQNITVINSPKNFPQVGFFAMLISFNLKYFHIFTNNQNRFHIVLLNETNWESVELKKCGVLKNLYADATKYYAKLLDLNFY